MLALFTLSQQPCAVKAFATGRSVSGLADVTVTSNGAAHGTPPQPAITLRSMSSVVHGRTLVVGVATLLAAAVGTTRSLSGRRGSARSTRGVTIAGDRKQTHLTTFVERRNASGGVALRAVLEKTEPSNRPVKVRFAPSPTGVLHVGGARTALFNWLFAKSQGGKLVLRVEDTDAARSTAASEAAILADLKWCGITWDEGPDVGGINAPYRQTERIEAGIYQKQLDRLIAEGHAYRCFLTAKELEAMRSESEKLEQAFVLCSPWATASEQQVQEMLDKEAPFVYRFRVPFDTEIVVNDLVLGEVIWNSDELGGDFVIVRQSGVPIYNFGVVVDDSSMNITHVLRAQEHLMNTPRQILIYRALGLEPPTFAHMPLILAPDRSKLSKRHGAVSVGDYRRQGYLPSGLINYLSQLGWNDGTNKEIYSVEELVSAFNMSRMSKVAAIFDRDKLRWVNGSHIKLLGDAEAQTLIGAELVRQGLVRNAEGEFVRRASLLLRDRIGTLTEAAEEIRCMLRYPLDDFLGSNAEQVLDGSFLATAECLFDPEAIKLTAALGNQHDAVKRLATYVSKARGGVKKKALLRPLRQCLTASEQGPSLQVLFEILAHIDDNVLCEHVALDQRLALLKERLDL
eukprot:TRINITY_DN76172_c0_g1_i1.p1 TRINITY_DN76172_c0_g1~~TRINITY_DN76172_c0_g1_i1.p1  ORF type:complete len:651 (-),score=94.93 TRINITY_DN76172_c0_g1_i1:121-2004(-)